MKRMAIMGAIIGILSFIFPQGVSISAAAETPDADCTGAMVHGEESTVPTINLVDDTTARNLPRTLRIYKYPEGWQFVQPPDDWSPITASDSELQLFGIPERSKETDALEVWESTWRHFTKSTPPTYCTTQYTATQSSQNWAGKLDHCAAGYCTKVSGVFKQPSLVSGTCPNTGTTHSTWTGLSNPGLLQIGTILDIAHSTSPYAFWEYINGPHNGQSGASVPVQKLTNFSLLPSQSIQATVQRAVNSSGTPVIIFNILNVDSGQSTMMGGFSSFNGFPISDYWNGTQAEYIDERLTVGSALTPYGQPNSNNVTWTSAYTNGVAANNSTFSPEDMKMTNTSGTTYIGYPSAYGSGGSFGNVWAYCG